MRRIFFAAVFLVLLCACARPAKNAAAVAVRHAEPSRAATAVARAKPRPPVAESGGYTLPENFEP